MSEITTRAEEGARAEAIALLDKFNALTMEDAIRAAVGAEMRARAAESRAASAEAEVERLRARLEIDHAYDIDGNPIPFPTGMEADLDGIACRDETIRQQDEQIAKFRDRVAALESALNSLLPGKLCGEAWGVPDEDRTTFSASFGQIRAARAALNGGSDV